MSIFLYLAIVSNETDAEIQISDQHVRENWEQTFLFFRNLPDNSRKGIKFTGKKIQRASAYFMFGWTLVSSFGALGQVIPLAPTNPSFQKIRRQMKELEEYNKSKWADHIDLGILDESSVIWQEDSFAEIQLMTNDLLYKLETGQITSEEALLQIRGGDLPGMMAVAVGIFAIGYVIKTGYDPTPAINAFLNGLVDIIENSGIPGALVDAFYTPLPTSVTHEYKHGRFKQKGYTQSTGLIRLEKSIEKYNTPTALEMKKPTEMPQQAYNSLPRIDKTYLPDPDGRDRSVQKEGYESIEITFNRVTHKFKKHSKVCGLPVNPETNKVPRTEENMLLSRDFLVEQCESGNTVQNDESTYQCKHNGKIQKGTSVYNKDSGLLIFFDIRPNGERKLLTYFELTDFERQYYLATNGAVVTEDVLEDSRFIASEPNWRDFEENKTSSSNPFSINQLSSLTSNNPVSPNEGSTIVSGTFETDVMNITPTDAHTNSTNSNNPFN